MKKITIIVTIIVAAICLIVLGFKTQNEPLKDPENNENGNENYGYAELDEDEDELEIKTPVVDWWKLYKNINKTNCVTLQVSNPNNFPIQFSYDLVYYKDNEAVKIEKKWAMTGIDSGKAGIIYGDIKIPSSDTVDRIELENIEVSKFEWKPIQGTFKETFIDNGVQYLDAKFSGKPDHTEIWVALYNDTNKDKKIQANEFVQMGLLAPFVGIYETEGQIQIPVSDERLTFTDYEIYCFAFTTKM